MGSNDTERATAHDDASENPPIPPVGPSDKSDEELTRARRWLVFGGFAAGLLAFGIGEAVYELIPPKIGQIRTMGIVTIAPTAETKSVAEVQNAALTFGVLGICLGGCLGMAAGLARRRTAATLIAGGLGTLLGLAAGAGISLALLRRLIAMQPNHLDYELLLSAIIHGTIWGPIGAVAGLAFAVGLGEPRMIGRCLAAGFAGAVVGTIAFDLIAAAAFPLASTGQPISTTWESRLLARLLVTVATAGTIALVVNRRSPDEQKEQSGPSAAHGRAEPTASSG